MQLVFQDNAFTRRAFGATKCVHVVDVLDVARCRAELAANGLRIPDLSHRADMIADGRHLKSSGNDSGDSLTDQKAPTDVASGFGREL